MTRGSAHSPSIVLIVGAGPAGVSAALHLDRQGIPLRLVSAGPVGGLLHAARCLDNLPGFPGSVPGSVLAAKMRDQLAERRISVWSQEIVGIRRSGDGLEAWTTSGELIPTASVILATGTCPVSLPADWLAIHPHRGADTLPGIMNGQEWLVSGGGDAAADTALSIADRGGTPRIVLRGDQPRWHSGLASELERRKIRIGLNEHPVPVTELPDGGIRLVMRDGIMTFAGLVCCHGRQPVIPDCSGLGPESGILVAGDADGNPLRYASRAMASGIEAAEKVAVWLRERG